MLIKSTTPSFYIKRLCRQPGRALSVRRGASVAFPSPLTYASCEHHATRGPMLPHNMTSRVTGQQSSHYVIVPCIHVTHDRIQCQRMSVFVYPSIHPSTHQLDGQSLCLEYYAFIILPSSRPSLLYLSCCSAIPFPSGPVDSDSHTKQ